MPSRLYTESGNGFTAVGGFVFPFDAIPASIWMRT
jgi:hypothetical protein